MHPALLHLHLGAWSRTIPSYGVMVALGAALGIATLVARAGRFGVARFDALAVGLLGLAGGLAGGMVLFFAVHLRLYLADPALAAQPGLVFYGGLVGGGAAAALYCRAYGVPLADVADAAVPGLALGHAVGRLGCLLGGCCYGRPVAAGFPLAVELAGTLRHPVQLYEAAGLIAIAIAAVATGTRLRRRPAALFALYLAAYAVLRLATEALRGDDSERGFLIPGTVSTSHALALVTLAGALALLHRVTHPRNGAS